MASLVTSWRLRVKRMVGVIEWYASSSRSSSSGVFDFFWSVPPARLSDCVLALSPLNLQHPTSFFVAELKKRSRVVAGREKMLDYDWLTGPCYSTRPKLLQLTIVKWDHLSPLKSLSPWLEQIQKTPTQLFAHRDSPIYYTFFTIPPTPRADHEVKPTTNRILQLQLQQQLRWKTLIRIFERKNKLIDR